jgi:hypothetical protein
MRSTLLAKDDPADVAVRGIYICRQRLFRISARAMAQRHSTKVERKLTAKSSECGAKTDDFVPDCA